MSVSQSMFHAYLSHGVPTSRIADLAHNRQEAATVRRTQEEMDCFPAPMDPQALHLLPPLKLPEEQLRSGAELADQQWSRRQFSVLWAPMPADYQLDDAAERKVR